VSASFLDFGPSTTGKRQPKRKLYKHDSLLLLLFSPKHTHTHTNTQTSPDNSKRDGCKDKDIVYCRTDSGRNDHFCRFDGTNHLIDEGEKWGSEPKCFFNCQVRARVICALV
jgi:hypothetical protein